MDITDSPYRSRSGKLASWKKLDSVRERVRVVAQEHGAGARLPPMAELCRELGISPNTLDKAFAELELEGVLQRRPRVGVFVGPDVTPQALPVTLICRTSFLHEAGHSPVWDALVAKMGDRAKTTGFQFDCSFSFDESDQKADEGAALLSPQVRAATEEGRLRGVLGIGLPGSAAKWFMAHAVPVVNLYGFGHVSLSSSVERLVEVCVQGLKSRGCRRVGLWSSTSPCDTVQESVFAHHHNIAMFVDALTANGLRVQPDLIESRDTDFQALWNRPRREWPSLAEQGFATAKRVFSGPRDKWPDGVVVPDDNMAYGALVALRQLGLHPGQDVHIAAGSNAGSLLQLEGDRLILAEVSVPEIVDTMFDRLQKLVVEIPPDLEEIVIVPHLRETSPFF